MRSESLISVVIACKLQQLRGDGLTYWHLVCRTTGPSVTITIGSLLISFITDRAFAFSLS